MAGSGPGLARRRRAAAAGLLSALVVILAALPQGSYAADWRVTPIRLEFGRNAKTGVITVANESDERLHLQLKASVWTQDAEGADRYEETNDLVFFPRILVFEGTQEKIVRVGIRVPAAVQEKTYRLFLEEVPQPKKDEGVAVRVTIRFGVPVFARPLAEDPRGEIGPVTMTDGTLSVPVKNTGNVHFAIRAINVTGKDRNGAEAFSTELGGWYLLAGARRTYSTAIPREKCLAASSYEIEVASDRLSLRGHLDADPAMCGP